jgi:hypothetical protein
MTGARRLERPWPCVGLSDAVEVAFRVAVLQLSDLPQVWVDVEARRLAEQCGCASATVTPCPHPPVCLAAALLTEDSVWSRAGLTRHQRQRIWVELDVQAILLEPALASHAGRSAALLRRTDT